VAHQEAPDLSEVVPEVGAERGERRIGDQGAERGALAAGPA
jgi:hypothetical protein